MSNRLDITVNQISEMKKKMTWEISPRTEKDTKTKKMRRKKKSDKQNYMIQIQIIITSREEKKANQG